MSRIVVIGGALPGMAAAARLAKVGEAVLLSPACASWDMFDGYAHRAQVFCEAVQALADRDVGEHA